MRILTSIKKQNTCVSSLTISLSIDGALIKGHDVLSERSGLVTEDVLNLK